MAAAQEGQRPALAGIPVAAIRAGVQMRQTIAPAAIVFYMGAIPMAARPDPARFQGTAAAAPEYPNLARPRRAVALKASEIAERLWNMAENQTPDILYTIVDEAPELASASFLPIIRKFAAAAGVSVGTKDISLAGRILAAFPEGLTAEQRQSDDLAELGKLVKTPDANVIKLPNISASVPQLVAAVTELQGQGYAIPDYPEEPQTD